MSTGSHPPAPGEGRPRVPLPVVPAQAPPGIGVGTPATAPVGATAGAACDVDDPGCITCGDVALPLTVLELRGSDALCRDREGREELVAIDLVGPVAVGDLLLVHARVALEQLDRTRQHD